MSGPTVGPTVPGRVLMNMVRIVSSVSNADLPPPSFPLMQRPWWIVDTGAASSMTNDLSKFVEGTYVPVDPGLYDVVGVGGHLTALGVGTVAETITIEGPDGSLRELNITLKNVLYVPDLQFNLLSISALNSDGYGATFLPGKACIYHPDHDISVPLLEMTDLFVLPTLGFVGSAPLVTDVPHTGEYTVHQGAIVPAAPVIDSESVQWKRDGLQI